MKMITSNSIKDVVCCLIEANDFSKAPLLASIAKEEGAGYSEIRIPLETTLAGLKPLFDLKGRIILAVDPRILREGMPESNELINQTQTVISNIVNLDIYGLELNYKLSIEFIKDIITILEDEKTISIVAKYFDHFPSKEEVEIIAQELKELDSSLIKLVIPVSTKFQALEVLGYHKLFKENEVIIVCSGQEGKIAQSLTPFYGSKFTYGYLSSESDEALTSLNYLKKSINSLIAMR